MKMIELHPRLVGTWTGTKRLWLEGAAGPVRSSACELVVSPIALGAFLSFAYTWAFEGSPQEGLLIAGNANTDEGASAAWADSWHMSGKLMHCTGQVEADGAIRLLGSYGAPPGPDWGWTIVLTLPAPDGLSITMCNVAPGCEPELAVQADFARRR